MKIHCFTADVPTEAEIIIVCCTDTSELWVKAESVRNLSGCKLTWTALLWLRNKKTIQNFCYMEALLNLQQPGAFSPLELSQGKVLFTSFSLTQRNQAELLWCPTSPGQELKTQSSLKSHPGFCLSQIQLGQLTKNPYPLFLLVFLHPSSATELLLSRNTHWILTDCLTARVLKE